MQKPSPSAPLPPLYFISLPNFAIPIAWTTWGVCMRSVVSHQIPYSERSPGHLPALKLKGLYQICFQELLPVDLFSDSPHPPAPPIPSMDARKLTVTY